MRLPRIFLVMKKRRYAFFGESFAHRCRLFTGRHVVRRGARSPQPRAGRLFQQDDDVVAGALLGMWVAESALPAATD